MALGKQAKIISDKQVRAVLAELDYPALSPPRPRDVPLIDEGRDAGRGDRLDHLGHGHRCGG